MSGRLAALILAAVALVLVGLLIYRLIDPAAFPFGGIPD